MKQLILLGVSGGIAAIKTPEIIRTLTEDGYDIRVILTKSACAFVSPADLEKLSGHPVLTDMFTPRPDIAEIRKNRTVEHIAIANAARLFVIIPATANVVAKLAHGIADDYLTTTALAATCPVLICPSMNVYMWNHPATQQNINRLRQFGYHTFGPDSGMLACGYTGAGRLPATDAILREIRTFAARTSSLAGKKILVTAGGTVEPIDGVRQITNKSTGKMGVALAQACFLRGADVLLLRSDTSVVPRYGIREILFDTSDSLKKLMHEHLPDTDICFHAAAVSDFVIKGGARGKISSETSLPLELTPRSKILDSVKSINPEVYLVAFKAEYDVTDRKLVELASDRLKRAQADCIIANDVGREGQGFATDNNDVWIIRASGGKPVHIPLRSKALIADAVIDSVLPDISGIKLRSRGRR